MSIPDLATLQTRLKEAEEAYHLLMTGSQEASVHIDGYGSITYTTASLTQLECYISHLKTIIARQTGRGGGRKALFVGF